MGRDAGRFGRDGGRFGRGFLEFGRDRSANVRDMGLAFPRVPSFDFVWETGILETNAEISETGVKTSGNTLSECRSKITALRDRDVGRSRFDVRTPEPSLRASHSSHGFL